MSHKNPKQTCYITLCICNINATTCIKLVSSSLGTWKYLISISIWFTLNWNPNYCEFWQLIDGDITENYQEFFQNIIILKYNKIKFYCPIDRYEWNPMVFLSYCRPCIQIFQLWMNLFEKFFQWEIIKFRSTNSKKGLKLFEILGVCPVHFLTLPCDYKHESKSSNNKPNNGMNDECWFGYRPKQYWFEKWKATKNPCERPTLKELCFLDPKHEDIVE